MVYDFIIIGAGPAGLIFAYLLKKYMPNKSFIIVEKGKPIYKRRCYITKDFCSACKQCNIISGIGGGGLFSDGKIIENSGWYVKDFTKDEIVKASNVLKKEILSLNPNYVEYNPFNYKKLEEVLEIVRNHGFSIALRKVYWYGTEEIRKLALLLSAAVNDRILFDEVVSIRRLRNDLYKVKTKNRKEILSKFIIVATGRYYDWRKLFNIPVGIAEESEPHIGIRVEVFGNPFELLSSIFYDVKLYKYNMRTFCFNPYGYVIIERKDSNEVFVNGHTMRYKKSKWTNFAIIGPNIKYIPTNIPFFINICGIIGCEKKQIKGGTLTYRKYSPKLLEILEGNIERFLIDLFDLAIKLNKDINKGANISKRRVKGFIYYPEVKLAVAKPLLRKLELKIFSNVLFIGESTGRIVGLWASMISAILALNEICNNYIL